MIEILACFFRVLWLQALETNSDSVRQKKKSRGTLVERFQVANKEIFKQLGLWKFRVALKVLMLVFLSPSFSVCCKM